MRKLFIILLLALCFPLFAQYNSVTAIYIPYVEGTGSGVEDNPYFTHLLEVETAARNFRVVKKIGEADYLLIGMISPYGERDFVFQLELVDNNNDDVIVQQEVIYRHYNEVHSLFPMLMLTMLSNIPEQPGKELPPMQLVPEVQPDYQLLLGAYGFWSPRIYTDNETSVYFLNFGTGLSAEWHFLDFLSVEAGVEFTSDWVLVVGMPNDDYRDYVLEIPFFIKYVFNPSDSFLPYAGIKTTAPLRRVTRPPAFSILVGFQYGIRLGPGFVFLDARYSADMGSSSVNTGFANQEYMRYMLNIGVGYKCGFFPKERK